MWIRVRTMDGKQTVKIVGLSKLTKVEELREKIDESFDCSPTQQRLFYRGKQMVDDHTLFDYNIGLNEIIQLFIKPPETADPTDKPIENGHTESEEEKTMKDPDEVDESMVIERQIETPDIEKPVLNGLYKVGGKVDARDVGMGAWFEAEVVDISLADENDLSSFLYHVKFDEYEENEISKLTRRDVRPRARTILQWEQIYVGQIVMANFNTDEPEERGFWYDVQITQKSNGSTRNSRKLFGKLLLPGVSESDTVAQECKLGFVDEVYKIEPAPDEEDGSSESVCNGHASPVKRVNKPDCNYCKDDKEKKCKHCACHKCGGKEDPDKQLLCDECDMAYHLYCLEPPLDTIPDVDEWYCPACKNDDSAVIKAGEKLRESKKKSKMASANSASSRDWGKGMACVGRTKVCTVVPSNHFGPIPGVLVGTCWKFRVQASEVGVHRPHVSGIHGRENEGAYSIVLAGGYEDDVDNGDEFIYTGSGGRDLSGNKRTAEQSCDQKLTKMNRALAKNCAADIDPKNGAEAKDWRAGKPVRVIRSYKLGKHSKYAPEEGNRYDGIYKIVKYFPEKGKSGFIVWRYVLRRDDETAAPWTKEGKKFIKNHGLELEYPEGYLEAQAKKQLEKNNNDEEGSSDEKPKKGKGKGKGKRKMEDKEKDPSSPSHSPAKKKHYSLPSEKKKLIDEDKLNGKLWKDLLLSLEDYPGFIKRVEEAFLCICCQEIVFKPITTDCLHNICKTCLQRSFKAEVYNCPTCRNELGKNYKMNMNSELDVVLNDLFPGYGKGR